MKKAYFILFICITYFALTACSPNILDFPIESHNKADKETIHVGDTEKESNNFIDFQFKEQLLMDKNNIRVTAKSVDLYSKNGPLINILIENNSIYDIEVFTINDFINGQPSDYFTGKNVLSGQSASTEIELYKYQLDQKDMVGTICLEFEIIAYEGPWSEPNIASQKASLTLELGNSINPNQKLTESYIEPQIIYENEYMSITAESLNINGIYGPEIDITIKNISDTDLNLETTYGSVNGYMADYALQVFKIPAHETIRETIHISHNSFKQCGITDITLLEFAFYMHTIAYEPIEIYTPVISLETNLYNTININNYPIIDYSAEIYNDNGIRIVPLGVYPDATHIGPSLLFYIENNNDETIWIQHNNVSVNNVSSSAITWTNILPHKKAIIDLTLLKNELPSENAVLDLTILDGKSPLDTPVDVRFKFNIYGDYMGSFETGYYTITY